MDPHPELQPILTLAGQGRPLHAFGDEITVLLSGAQTGNKYAMGLSVTPPHAHGHEDEMFHVLEGRVSFLVNGTWQEVPPGTTAFLPKNAVHTFKNVGDTMLKMIVTVSPAGFENFFSKCAAEFAKPGGPNMARIMAIAGEHGIRFATP